MVHGVLCVCCLYVCVLFVCLCLCVCGICMVQCGCEFGVSVSSSG